MSKDNSEARRLRIALHAYPRAVRQAEGEVLTSLVLDLVDDGQSSTNREALGLLRGGFVARTGALADAPWGKALHRAGLPIAAALLALSIGALAFWMDGIAWPGWSWIAVLAAPALAVAGLLGGWRLPLVLGGILICLLGIAQGNGPLLTTRLQGSVNWQTSGFDLPLLACAIPAGLLLLAASLSAGRRASRTTVLATLTWVVAGAISVRLLFGQAVIIGSVTLDGLAICLAAYGIAMIIATVVGAGRRRRDPTGMLAGILGLATVLPIILLYGISTVPLNDSLLLILFALSVLATTTLLIWTVRLVPTLKR